MNRYQDLTADELKLLSSTPMLAGAVVMALDGGGLTSAMRETWASAKVVSEAKARFPNNDLVALIHGELHDPESYKKDASKTNVSTNKSPILMEAFVEHLDQALNVLDKKIAPADATGYKQLVYGCAEAAAQAVKEGGVLGIGGKRVSDNEAVYLDHLRNRLGL